jgi:hypothetical protein
MNVHKSCSSLPIYNFYKIIESYDYKYMVIGYNDLIDDDPEIDEKECFDYFEDIITEYGEITSNSEVLLNVLKQIDIVNLQYELDCIINILEIVKETEDLETLLLLKHFGINIDFKKNIENQINNVAKRVKSLRNKIKIKKAKYSTRFKDNNEKVKIDLDKEALMLEIGLDLGREIDIRTTTVKRWVNLISASKEKNKQYEKLKS